MKRLATTFSTLALAVTGALASVTLGATPASAEPGPSTEACLYVWLYSGTNYSGNQYYLNCDTGGWSAIKTYPQNIRSVINHNESGVIACGIDNNNKYWRFEGYYQWPDVGGSVPIRAFAWNNTPIGVDPTGAPLFIEC